MTPAPGPRSSALDRALRVFTDVRPGEGVTALLLALNVFMLLTSYSIAKVLREPLIIAGGNAELKAYSAAGQAVLLLILVPAYGALAARAPRRTLITVVTGFFLACMLGFYALGKLGAPIGVPFYLWIGVFSLMIIAQFWSFANDLYTTEEGKRLFPLIQFGASVGAVTGSLLAGLMIRPLGLFEPLLLAALLLAGATALTLLVDRRERRRTETDRSAPLTSGTLPAATAQYRADTGEFKAVVASEAYSKASGTFKVVKPGTTERDEVKATRGAFGLVLRNPYLLAIAMMIVLLNWVNHAGEYALDLFIQDWTREDIGQFKAAYQAGANILSLVLQLFVVSRLLKHVGVRIALLVLPLIVLVGYSALVVVFVPGLTRWIKTVENGTDYSLQNTLRSVLFLPTTREEKYSAKQAIDSFFARAGDVLSAAMIFAGTHWLAMQGREFVMVNIALILAWLALAVLIGRRYERLSQATAT